MRSARLVIINCITNSLKICDLSLIKNKRLSKSEVFVAYTLLFFYYWMIPHFKANKIERFVYSY